MGEGIMYLVVSLRFDFRDTTAPIPRMNDGVVMNSLADLAGRLDVGKNAAQVMAK